MIKTDKVSKYFHGFQALKDISFEIAKGEIVGFLGQNGAGKTTLMRILTGYLSPSAGEVTVAGLDVQKNAIQVRQHIGYLPETPPLYNNMSVTDYLKFAAALKDVPGYLRKKAVDKALSECLLQDVKHHMISTLSKGYKQRVGLAQAVLNDPPVLILDEPTTGLDPVQNNQIRELIRSLEAKRTVLLSTHYLTEIEAIAKRVLMIKNGRLIMDSPLHDILGAAGAVRRLDIAVRGNKERIYQMISAVDGPELLSSTSDGDVHHLRLEIKSYVTHYNSLVEKIIASGVEFLGLKEQGSTLEDVFFRMIKEDKD